MKMELDEKEMESALCVWAMGWQRGNSNPKFNKATFYKLERGYSVTLEYVDPNQFTEQGR